MHGKVHRPATPRLCPQPSMHLHACRNLRMQALLIVAQAFLFWGSFTWGKQIWAGGRPLAPLDESRPRPLQRPAHQLHRHLGFEPIP